VLEYRWDDWKDDYGERLFAGLASLLSGSERACLVALAARPDGMTGTEWQRRVQPGTEPAPRLPGRLVQLGLAAEVATDAEPRFSVTGDGVGVLGVLAASATSVPPTFGPDSS
jgi:hypothetical protein